MLTAQLVEQFRAWASTGILGAILAAVVYFGKPVARYLIESRKVRIQEKADDRQGYGSLIALLNDQVKMLSDRVGQQEKQIASLVIGRDRDHGLILALLQQLNRTQVGAVLRDLGPEGVSPEITSMFKTLMEFEPGRKADA